MVQAQSGKLLMTPVLTMVIVQVKTLVYNSCSELRVPCDRRTSTLRTLTFLKKSFDAVSMLTVA